MQTFQGRSSVNIAHEVRRTTLTVLIIPQLFQFLRSFHSECGETRKVQHATWISAIDDDVALFPIEPLL